jgi:hypothetical protein
MAVGWLEALAIVDNLPARLQNELPNFQEIGRQAG